MKIEILSLVILVVFATASCHDTKEEYETDEQHMQTQKTQEIYSLSDSAGVWHNQFMDVCMSDVIVTDTLIANDIREERINDLAVIFFSLKFELSHHEIKQIVNDFLGHKNSQSDLLASTDLNRARIFGVILDSYSTLPDAQAILSVFDSLKTSEKEFIRNNPDVNAVLNLAEASVYYWTESSREIGLSKRDPLTARQRQILNADGDAAIDGAIGGFILGCFNPFAAVSGCIVGGSIGSIRKAIELN